MPRIEPIDAICFAAAVQGPAPRDVSALISPPYDVLAAADKQQLLRADPHNIVALDLPHVPPGEPAPNAEYEAAAQTLAHWLRDGVLRRLGRRIFLLYEQAYEYDGRPRLRRGIIANLPVQPFGRADASGGVFPHEQTFSGPKEDRLKLMRATHCQLSPIFGMYADPANQAGALLGSLMDSRPEDFAGKTHDGVLHRLWIVQDPSAQRRLQELLSGRDVFIADGHHRYTTALNYLEELKTSSGEGAGPAAWCTFVLVSMQDPGMRVLPTHRVLLKLRDFSMARFCEIARGKLRMCRFESADLRELEAALPTAGPHAIGLYDATEPDPHRRLWIATSVDDDPLAVICPKQGSAWRQLDVAIGQCLIVERMCEPAFSTVGTKLEHAYAHTLQELRRIADTSDRSLGIVLQPTPLAAVQEVSQAGDLMPHKSTYFYPKVATGLVINPLY